MISQETHIKILRDAETNAARINELSGRDWLFLDGGSIFYWLKAHPADLEHIAS